MFVLVLSICDVVMLESPRRLLSGCPEISEVPERVSEPFCGLYSHDNKHGSGSGYLELLGLSSSFEDHQGLHLDRFEAKGELLHCEYPRESRKACIDWYCDVCIDFANVWWK
jgi:hypothetical protein